MNESTIAELAGKNRDLRQLVTRLSAIILRNAANERGRSARESRANMTPVERVSRMHELSMHSGQLREISIRLMRIGLACREAAAAGALKALAAEFADEAGHVDALIATSRANE
jgi:hypothetical protein